MSLEEATARIVAPKRLSVLIPSLYSRLAHLRALTEKLRAQIGDRTDVEIVSLLDDKTEWLGDKRNRLMEIARGEYLTFVNDDDDVPPDWLARVTHYMDNVPDVDVYSVQAECFAKDRETGHWFRCWFMSTSISYGPVNVNHIFPDPNGVLLLDDGRRATSIMTHPPWMWCIWRSTVARKARFASQTYGEDSNWAYELTSLAQSECVVPEVLYRYYADDATSEAGPWKDVVAPSIQFGGKKILESDPGIINAGRFQEPEKNAE